MTLDKKITTYKHRLLLLAMLTMVVTCTFGQTTLVLDRSTLVFNSDAQDELISILESDGDWIVVSDQTWLTITAPSGGSGNGAATITIHVEENSGTTDRTAIITATSGTLSKTISVTQYGKVTELVVSTNNMEFSATGNTQSFTIISNISWIVTTNDSWITVSPESGNNYGKVTVTASENNTGTDRTAEIIVSGDGIIEKIKVKQYMSTAFLVVSTHSISSNSTGGLFTFGIASNISWTVTCSEDWMTATPTNGMGNGTITLSIAPNNESSPRYGTVTVSGQGVTETIIVNGFTPPSIPKEFKFNSEANSQSFYIYINKPWAVTSSAEWIAISPTSGLGGWANISIFVSTNQTEYERSATITISCEDVDYPIAVIQQGVSPSGIRGINRDGENKYQVFNLFGQPTLPNTSGLYVINGKKVLLNK